MHTREFAWCVFAVAASAASACGAGGAGEVAEAPEPVPAEATAGGEVAEPAPVMAVSGEGFMGTIPERAIEEALEPKMPKFQRCFFEGAQEVELIGGHIKFYFRVGLDGRVEWVHPRGASIGHRATEKCLLALAAATRFPKPRGGGPAEFVWGFEIDPVGGMRPPVAWEEDRMRATVRAQRGSLAHCELDGGRLVVTVYVAPGGEVTSAGAASDSHEASAKIDCVVDAVRAWHMPDPGSYAAKVSFKVP